MAGYTDRITREIALRYGAHLAFTEMVSAEGLVRGGRRSRLMTARAAGESLLAVQLFGRDAEVLGRAATAAAEAGADLVDLNAGCPVAKVVRKGAGAAMMRDPDLIARSVKAMRQAGRPVTVKIRVGWDEGEPNWPEVAAAAEEAGAAALAFHPRTREQAYGGRADWSLIARLVESVSIPVIGSGDLEDPESVGRMVDETGCAAVMIARGAVGNPWIFSRTLGMAVGGAVPPPPDAGDRCAAALAHLEGAADLYGPEAASRLIKKHLNGYIRGWESAVRLRRLLMSAESVEAMRELLQPGSPPSR